MLVGVATEDETGQDLIVTDLLHFDLRVVSFLGQLGHVALYAGLFLVSEGLEDERVLVAFHQVRDLVLAGGEDLVSDFHSIVKGDAAGFSSAEAVGVGRKCDYAGEDYDYDRDNSDFLRHDGVLLLGVPNWATIISVTGR
jgi:hypothetical protein